MKTIQKQLEELKKAIILYENAYDDDIADRFDDLLEEMQQLHGSLENFIEKNLGE
jgi:hypothetical protein